MELLKQRILQEGFALPGNVLKVDSFLNHQIDPALSAAMGKEFAQRFADFRVDRVLTIEASGIAIACMAARHFNVPVVFAKKAKSKNIDGEVYTSTVHSYTYGRDYDITLSKKFLSPSDKVLILDDFLANGDSALGMARIVEAAGSEVAGIGIVIEKSFQAGHKRITDAGYRLESLARIKSLDDCKIIFAED